MECVKCVYIWLGRRRRRRGELMRRLCLSFTNPVGTRGMFEECLCLSWGDVGGVGGEWLGGFEQGLEEWGGVMSV